MVDVHRFDRYPPSAVVRYSNAHISSTPDVTSTLKADSLLPCAIYDTSVLRSITHVMDIEGFYVDSLFYTKEFVVLAVDTDQATRFDVRLSRDLDELSVGQRAQVRWTTENIHGMPWSNDDADLIEPNDVLKQVASYFLYEKAISTRPLLVAYKGGRLEFDLLSSLKLPSINLELFGCRTFDYLIAENNFPRALRGYEGAPHLMSIARSFVSGKTYVCKNHFHVDVRKDNNDDERSSLSSGRKRTRFHCPVEECRVFARWIEHAILETELKLGKCALPLSYNGSAA